MNITAISDTHGFLPLNIYECDVLCIAGDIVPLQIQRQPRLSIDWLKGEFIPWTEKIPCKYVVLVAGNHDFVFELLTKEFDHEWIPSYYEELKTIFDGTKIKYLCNTECEIDGKKFFGTPYVTGLRNWAFNTDDDSQMMNNIPDCDVLISHAPPSGPCGTVQHGWNKGNDFGSESLRTRMQKGGIAYCFCGHIHSGERSELIGETRCFNVSLKSEDYDVVDYPTILSI